MADHDASRPAYVTVWGSSTKALAGLRRGRAAGFGDRARHALSNSALLIFIFSFPTVPVLRTCFSYGRSHLFSMFILLSYAVVLRCGGPGKGQVPIQPPNVVPDERDDVSASSA